MRHRSDQLSVEDLIIMLRRLPPGRSPIPAVAQGLRSLDSRACAALLKDLSKVGLPHHALTIFEWLQALPPENDLARLCDVFTYTTGGDRRPTMSRKQSINHCAKGFLWPNLLIAHVRQHPSNMRMLGL